MSVPSRRESAVLLLSLEPPAWHLRHSRAVAETAAWLAWRAASAGVSLDRRLVESAALLHDIDKLQRVEPETAGLAHGEGSADWLARRGYAELGPVIVGHPVTKLADTIWFERWLAEGVARDARPRLCRQARRIPSRVDGRAFRILGTALPAAGQGGSGARRMDV